MDDRSVNLPAPRELVRQAMAERRAALPPDEERCTFIAEHAGGWRCALPAGHPVNGRVGHEPEGAPPIHNEVCGLVLGWEYCTCYPPIRSVRIG